MNQRYQYDPALDDPYDDEMMLLDSDNEICRECGATIYEDNYCIDGRLLKARARGFCSAECYESFYFGPEDSHNA